MMEKLLLIEKRVKARELHKEKGWSVRKISRYLVASRDSISKWIKTDEKEVTQDRRGWKKDKPRVSNIRHILNYSSFHFLT